MQLTPPVIITTRLMPGVRIGNSFISIDYRSLNLTKERRVYYCYWLDLDLDGTCIEHYGEDLSTGCNHGLAHALADLLVFLSACGQGQLESDNLFPINVEEWCYQNIDELSILSMELEETEGLIIE